MLTNKWFELTRKTRNYRLKVRLGWTLWLPKVQTKIHHKPLWEFINDYWQDFVDIVRAEYGIDLENATDSELAIFFSKTGLYHIELKDNDTFLSKNQRTYIATLMKHYAPQVLQWLKQGDVYASENVF